jgi:hypothetical protein
VIFPDIGIPIWVFMVGFGALPFRTFCTAKRTIPDIRPKTIIPRPAIGDFSRHWHPDLGFYGWVWCVAFQDNTPYVAARY